ncbi:type II toxin-antitoxin system HicB family antitoxin [Rhodoplanes sp. SY1]|uniref:type II toxin-antitoxin system HicB family antitoxin n=1 Tax=Rhodoplanes sp. SY1 TaxID=3166646 RepID=UPI0038B69F9D
MTEFSFSVVLEPQPDGGFTVSVPALPEVVTEGDTEAEALANAEEGIRAILAHRRDNGLARPKLGQDLRAELKAGVEALERGDYVEVEVADLGDYLDRLTTREARPKP